MLKKIVFSALFIVFLSGMLFFSRAGAKSIFNSQPEWYFLQPHSYKRFMHILGVGLGFRSLVGDFEYIGFLQYIGNPENAKNRYKDLYEYVDRITDADPHFSFAYRYGSAVMAFHLKQYEKAEKIIEKGLKYNPKMWRLRMYLGAIGYKEADNKEKYVKFLEEALDYKDHPAMLERLLGNIYEQYKPADEVVKYWLKIYKNTGDDKTKRHAYERIISYIKSGKLKNPGLIRKHLD